MLLMQVLLKHPWETYSSIKCKLGKGVMRMTPVSVYIAAVWSATMWHVIEVGLK